MWCVTAFGYASNDLFDIAEDRINKPDRPLPSGTIDRQSAQRLIAILAVAALLVSWSIGWLPAIVAVLVMVLLTLYNSKLKGSPAFGNLLIALLAGCTLLVGAVASKGPMLETLLLGTLLLETLKSLLIPSSILAAFIVTREILKTVEDEVGDRDAGRQTITTHWNSYVAARMVKAGAVLTILLIPLPFLLQSYSITYLFVALLGVGGPLLYTLLSVQADCEIGRVKQCLALLKASYFAGILAIWLA